ncbi:MoxR family ATPase [Aliifodinibius sp. S!AR15-10]|uniref:AAA family ATPase n=1 Tax=Aliifodinibius sp. S!AR15-10 TaxID=2950437 RepID=UPI002867552F|nr:MoxR family ATPase [Aliifodinibius sp. S!AR15-10]MDR8393200.1 MoxR family ATPase [Aliifodinibius sp. S!AR15-10]
MSTVQNNQKPADNSFAPSFEERTDLSGIKKTTDEIRNEISKIIVGQQKMVDQLIAALLANGHVLIEGVPGVAKTLTARLLARVLSMDFSRIQFTPDLMPADIIGTSVFNPDTTEFTFKEGPIFSNVVLVDEINRSPAKTQAALFEVMQEMQVTVDGKTYEMARPYFIMATQNPIEHEGTYKLPEAQMDRFLFKIEVPYPNLEEETDILEGFHQRKNVNDPGLLDPIVSAEEIVKNQETVSVVHVDKSLMKYIAEIVQYSRNDSAIYIGASPRASVFIMRASQAWAAMHGRDFVIPEDIQTMIYPVLHHRIILTPEKEMEGLDEKKVIKRLLEKVEVPR